MAGLRPIRSDSGPNRIWPNPSPKKTAMITNWASFARSSPRSRPISGERGQHRIDGESDEREEKRDEGHELPGA